LDEHYKLRKLERMERQKQKEALERASITHPGETVHTMNEIKILPAVEEDYPPGLMAGIKQAKKHPWIIIAFICEFLAITHANSMGITFQFYCIELDGHQSAIKQAIQLRNKEQLVHIFAALLFGYYADRFNRFIILMITITLALLGTFLITLMPSPYHPIAYMTMFIFGIANAGFTTVNMNVFALYPDPKYRASVRGLAAIVGAFSNVWINIFGQYLSKYNGLIPYYMYMGFVMASYVPLLIMYARNTTYYDSIKKKHT